MPHKVKLTYEGRMQRFIHITPIDNHPIRETHALEIIVRDLAAQTILMGFLVVVDNYTDQYHRAMHKKKETEKVDKSRFQASTQFMLQNGWNDEQKAKRALQGSQRVLNEKHFGRPATDMVILANPELGDINDQSVRTKVQRKTIGYFASPLYHSNNENMR